MFTAKCCLRRSTLPLLPCDCIQCEWHVSDSNFNNCFWFLAEFMHHNPGITMSFEQISKTVKLPLQEVINIFETALVKIRKESVKLVRDEVE